MSTELKQARLSRGHTQQEAAARLGVSQAYLSMLESGKRKPSTELARKLMRLCEVPATVLPVTDVPKRATADYFAGELAALGYPGFAHLRGSRKMNPAQFLLMALEQNNLEARVAEGLPWVVSHYSKMNWDWLTTQAWTKRLQNRLGFVVTLAHRASGNAALETPERTLADSKLAKVEPFCRELNEAEHRWLQEHSSEEAQQWNLLSDLRPDQLRYVA